MNQTYSIYDLATGLFTQWINCPVDSLDLNVPEGFGCILGEYDLTTQMVDVDTSQVIDNIPPQPSENHVWDAELRQWVYVPTREYIENAVWESIKAHREKCRVGGVTVNGKWFHSDDSSRIQQIGLVMMGASLPTGLQWKTMDGTFIEMTQALAGAIFAAIAGSDQTIFAVAESHRAAMLSSENPSDYDFSASWPTIYGA